MEGSSQYGGGSGADDRLTAARAWCQERHCRVCFREWRQHDLRRSNQAKVTFPPRFCVRSFSAQAQYVGDQIAELIWCRLQVRNLGMWPQHGLTQRCRRGRRPVGNRGECRHVVAADSLFRWGDDVAVAAKRPRQVSSLGGIAGLLRGHAERQNSEDDGGDHCRTTPRSGCETAQVHGPNESPVFSGGGN